MSPRGADYCSEELHFPGRLFLLLCRKKRRGNTHRLNIGEAMFGQLVPAGEKVVPQLELLGQGAPGGISFPNVFAAVLSLQDLERKLK